MASATTISFAQYLGTSYSPDCDFVDGEVRERNVGTFEHSRTQILLAALFLAYESQLGLIALTEQRIRVSPTRIRIPDLAVVPFGPTPDVLDEPPVLVVEILSADDSYPTMKLRCAEYRAMGVENIWILDPQSRTGQMLQPNGWVVADRLEAVGSAVTVDLAELFRRVEASRIRTI
jgi:Uma2 family endonuclease